MNVTAITLAALGLASAASVAMAAPASDVDYLRASRCRGIAVGLGQDPAAIDAYLKTASSARTSYIMQRADDEFARGKRDGRAAYKVKAEAEYAGACTAYMAPAKAVASR